MAWIAVHNPEQLTEDVAAMRIHGFYGTPTEAQQAARDLAADVHDVHAYVVDECNRWILVREPEPGTGVEEEEIASPENNDPAGGRMGSVCDLRNRVNVVADRSGLDDVPGVVSSAFPQPTKGEQAAKHRDGSRQRTQLERLLTESVSPVTTAEAYASARERYALLRAFERRLRNLYAEGLDKCRKALAGVSDLDARHPEYRRDFRENYRRALRESGIPAEEVSFMRFLTEV